MAQAEHLSPFESAETWLEGAFFPAWGPGQNMTLSLAGGWRQLWPGCIPHT